MTLTRPMRDTLEQAVRQELRRVHDSPRPDWPAHPSTLHALVRHGLLERRARKSKRGHRLDTWMITTAGRDALQPREVLRNPPPMYLGRGVPATAAGTAGHGEFTTNKAFAIDHLAVVDPDTLNDAWEQEAEHRHAAAADRRARARQLAKNARAA